MMRVEWARKGDVRAVRCYYLNGGYNHSSTCVKVLNAETWAVCHTKDIVWTVPQVRPPAAMPPAAEGGNGIVSELLPPQNTAVYTITTAAEPAPATAATAA
ncbi:unnamed protein product, partial [Pylaiella littoralis]